VAGYPTITVPAGLIFGLPVGLSLIGPAWSEAKLLRLAYAFEQATKERRKPELRGTVELG
jgi:amidase